MTTYRLGGPGGSLPPGLPPYQGRPGLRRPRLWPPEKAERALRYRVEGRRKGFRRWEELSKTDDLHRALSEAVKRARVSADVTYRVWDFHGMKEVWQGKGARGRRGAVEAEQTGGARGAEQGRAPVPLQLAHEEGT